MYYLNKACEIQITTLSASQKVTIPSPEVCEHAARQHDDYAYLDTVHLDPEWTALLRLLERDGANYRCQSGRQAYLVGGLCDEDGFTWPVGSRLRLASQIAST